MTGVSVVAVADMPGYRELWLIFRRGNWSTRVVWLIGAIPMIVLIIPMWKAMDLLDKYTDG